MSWQFLMRRNTVTDSREGELFLQGRKHTNH